MKKKLCILLPILLTVTLCLLCLPSCGGTQERRYGSYRYIVENGEVTITEYIGVAADVTIPDTVKDMPVVAIGDSAFRDCYTLESVTIPDSVEEIGFAAFDSCISLENVTLGKGIRVIDAYAFDECTKLNYTQYEKGYYLGTADNPYYALVSMSHLAKTAIIHPDTVIICGVALDNCSYLSDLVIPEGVISIGGFALPRLKTLSIPASMEYIDSLALEYCRVPSEITVAEGNPNYKSVDGSLFSHDGTRLIKYACGKEAESYTVPEGTIVIEHDAFAYAGHLTEVTLPDSVEDIGHMAFIQCEKLQSIHLGNGLKRINGSAFGACSSLTEITIPDSVEKIPYSAFSGCEKLEKVVIGSGVTYLGDGVFWGCDALTEVVFSDPKGWRVSAMYSLTHTKVDVSDPAEAAKYLTGEYCEYFWRKK